LTKDVGIKNNKKLALPLLLELMMGCDVRSFAGLGTQRNLSFSTVNSSYAIFYLSLMLSDTNFKNTCAFSSCDDGLFIPSLLHSVDFSHASNLAEVLLRKTKAERETQLIPHNL
jgi:hypothetical protein